MLNFLALAVACAPSVAPVTMAAVVRAESGFVPWRIGVDYGLPLAREPQSLDEAVAIAKRLLAEGDNLDLGLAQINSANLPALGLTVDEVFDPCRNLAAAATVLTYCYARARQQYAPVQPALQAALSCYNSNSLETGFANGYVQRVVAGSADFVPAIDPHFPVPATPRRTRSGGIVMEPAGSEPAVAPSSGPRLISPRGFSGRGVTVIRGNPSG